MNKMKKPKSLRPPMPIVTPTVKSNNSDTDSQFELELCWCVHQLENALNSGKLSQKVAEDTIKNLKVLKGNSAPLIKKRQVMKAAMGDYRAKMKEEEKKMSLAPKQIKFTNSTEVNKKSSFVKKSAILTSGKDFKFNFNPSNAVENQTQESEQQPKETTDASNFKATNLQLTSGSGFKFNFAIDEVNNEIKFDELSIK
ncbi:UPF0488 protein CG14286-like [Lucilia sericata]|uniref:LOW QUALITY PROTEIN: UPF0488 protein CG14286-like n=1 Tax=Lucilia sericata TaxID=13632 RepID=UPI0018A82021|nr:LOW QUALITY PROTEIN: UPF0488 protein CG14286-like [Lucilia sericata]XP_037824230.1 UPF0488 protein CG14286-like [Lucilia sericata]